MARLDKKREAERFEYLAEGNYKQARKRVAVDLLIRDRAGRSLLVNPTYKDFWDIPGGMAEANESLAATARRELREELGLLVDVGRLLVVDWVGPHGPWDDQLVFIFDGGVLDAGTIERIRIHDRELEEFAFLGHDDSRDRLRPDMWTLLWSAHECLENGTTQYLENHLPL